MKKLLNLAVIIPVFIVFSSCEKRQQDGCNYTDCDRVILQILDNSVDGDDNWTDIATGNSYTNVVSYYSTCAFAQATNNSTTADIYIEGAVTVNEQQFSAECVQCQAVSPAPPQTKIDMTGISLTPCNGGE
jgi:hypothetical protein